MTGEWKAVAEASGRAKAKSAAKSPTIHQAFHVEGVTDPATQQEKLARTGRFGFFHDHPKGQDCNPRCHAVNPARPAK